MMAMAATVAVAVDVVVAVCARLLRVKRERTSVRWVFVSSYEEGGSEPVPRRRL